MAVESHGQALDRKEERICSCSGASELGKVRTSPAERTLVGSGAELPIVPFRSRERSDNDNDEEEDELTTVN